MFLGGDSSAFWSWPVFIFLNCIVPMVSYLRFFFAKTWTRGLNERPGLCLIKPTTGTRPRLGNHGWSARSASGASSRADPARGGRWLSPHHFGTVSPRKRGVHKLFRISLRGIRCWRVLPRGVVCSGRASWVVVAAADIPSPPIYATLHNVGRRSAFVFIFPSIFVPQTKSTERNISASV